MIRIQNHNPQQVVRYLADLFEPFIVKILQKKFHTFFVYRCSDYETLDILLKLHRLNMDDESLKTLLSKYWTAIDAIYFKIEGIPPYDATRAYFEKLRSLQISEKNVIGFEAFEIKLARDKKPNISVKTHEFIKEIEKIGKKLNFVIIDMSGELSLNYRFEEYEDGMCTIRTHYGRKGYYLRPKTG